MPGYLNRQFSNNLIRFFLSNLEYENNRVKGILFFSNTLQQYQQLVQEYAIRSIPDFASITKEVTSWKGILRSLSVNLSTSRELFNDVDTWIDEEDEGRDQVRPALKNWDKCVIEEDRTVINGVKELARHLIRVEDFITVKSNIASNLRAAIDIYEVEKKKVKNVVDLVGLKTITRDEGKRRCQSVMTSFADVETYALSLFRTSPEEALRELTRAITGVARGPDRFEDLIVSLNQEEYRDTIKYEERVSERADIPWLENEFSEFCKHITAYNKSMEDREERENNIERCIANLKSDVEETLCLVFEDACTLSLKPIAELNHLLRRIDRLETRVQETRNQSASGNFNVTVTINGVEETRTASSMILKAQNELAGAIGEKVEGTKDEDLKRKIHLQSIERQAKPIALPDLNGPEDFLVWMSSYTPLRKNFKNSNMTDWRLRLRDKIKESLKREQDKKAVKGLLDLKEVEKYINLTYVQSCSLINDILSPIYILKQPKNPKQSVENLQEVIKLWNLIRKRKMEEKITEAHVDRIIQVTLLRVDLREYTKAWSNEIRKKPRRTSTRLPRTSSRSSSSSVIL